ncbi:hypothetical protein MPH_01092 [Macrophomina phaseolina MS6]|uniref:Uncharacterized protein n=1 Tax=Macrophomina phaseolina (strain MS6) TaxID=1126212 RepID=K2SGN7_MACPH|nr:hypothetical protein MPH_01092 [Macrophomina phaseolina MS6]
MPLPPMELFNREPEDFIMEFMFLPRPSRMREIDLEFYCLHWKPLTREILERCCEYLSEKLVALMNENAALERNVKGLGARRTSVLTDQPYGVITVELMRDESWDHDDIVWCICEGMKKFPRELSRNQRFKARLSLPVPGKDYDIIRGVVQDEINKKYSGLIKKKNTKELKCKMQKAASTTESHSTAGKLDGARGSATNVRNGTWAAKKAHGNQSESPAKRAVKDDSSESEFNAMNASPKKKGRATRKTGVTSTSTSTPRQPATPIRGRNSASGASSKQTPKNSNGGSRKRGLKSGKLSNK